MGMDGGCGQRPGERMFGHLEFVGVWGFTWRRNLDTITDKFCSMWRVPWHLMVIW